jgi:predicted alpha/beta-hydrolase family hydrolase
MSAPFNRDFLAGPAVRGVLDEPSGPVRSALVLTHGAGGNCQSPVLAEIAEEFTRNGILVLRCDLPFRQKRPHGPPYRQDAAVDREGLLRALTAAQELTSAPVYLGGHSYGGRQASMLAAEDAAVAPGLLLLSYPLHPPGKREELRTAHFPALQAPTLFVQGSNDGFGSLQEMEAALQLIPAPKRLLPVPGSGHDLGFGKKKDFSATAGSIVTEFSSFFEL